MQRAAWYFGERRILKKHVKARSAILTWNKIPHPLWKRGWGDFENHVIGSRSSAPAEERYPCKNTLLFWCGLNRLASSRALRRLLLCAGLGLLALFLGIVGAIHIGYRP